MMQTRKKRVKENIKLLNSTIVFQMLRIVISSRNKFSSYKLSKSFNCIVYAYNRY